MIIFVTDICHWGRPWSYISFLPFHIMSFGDNSSHLPVILSTTWCVIFTCRFLILQISLPLSLDSLLKDFHPHNPQWHNITITSCPHCIQRELQKLIYFYNVSCIFYWNTTCAASTGLAREKFFNWTPFFSNRVWY